MVPGSPFSTPWLTLPQMQSCLETRSTEQIRRVSVSLTKHLRLSSSQLPAGHEAHSLGFTLAVPSAWHTPWPALPTHPQGNSSSHPSGPRLDATSSRKPPLNARR